MPRVVPSDVVAAADRGFSHLVTNPTSFPGLGPDYVPQLAALAELVDAVAPELITVQGHQYTGLLASVAYLRSFGEGFRGGRQVIAFNLWGYDRNPVALVREAMAACPDEASAPATVSLLFITDADLRESIRLDISAANSDLADGRWKGCTVLAGSAVEALLLWGLQRHEHANPGTRRGAITALRVGNTPLSRDPDANIEKWDLHEYTEVAAHLRVIEPDTAAQVSLARTFRNLIHPGRAQRLGQKADRFTALGALAAVEGVARDLA